MQLRVIPTKVHGIVDYIEGPALLAAPEIFKLKGVPASALVPRLAGGLGAAYSAATDYEVGLVRKLPMKGHLALDVATGALLAASPWLFKYAKAGRRYWLPHAIVGGGKLAVALTTKTQPADRVQGHRAA